MDSGGFHGTEFRSTSSHGSAVLVPCSIALCARFLVLASIFPYVDTSGPCHGRYFRARQMGPPSYFLAELALLDSKTKAPKATGLENVREAQNEAEQRSRRVDD